MKLEPRIIKPRYKQSTSTFLVIGLLVLGLVASFAFIYFSQLLPSSKISSTVTPLSVTTLPTTVNLPQPINTLAFKTPVVIEAIQTSIPHTLPSLAIGQPAPNFTLNNLDGKSVSLSDFTGQVVLINFWASWCQPCRIEMPELVKAYETYRKKGFVILGVNLTDQDQMSDITAFVEEFHVSYPILLDTEGTVSDKLYYYPGIPMSVFVNRQGNIDQVQIGAMSKQQIEDGVNALLKK
ncbi:MAG: TlpA disulfide reductase family protein [Chloroflexota bacterium]